jgi:hypothetical protein
MFSPKSSYAMAHKEYEKKIIEVHLQIDNFSN